MNRIVAAIFGLLPAGLMTLMALVGLGFLEDWRMILVPAAVLGFIGMGWAFLGYAPKSLPWVVVMLVIGEVAMGWCLITQLADLASPNKAMGWKVFSMWATLGPCLVGAAYLWQAVMQRPAAGSDP